MAAQPPSTGFAPVPSDFVRSAHLACDEDGQNNVIAAAASLTEVVIGVVAAGAKKVLPMAASSPSLAALPSVARCVAVDATRRRVAVGGDGKAVHVFTLDIGAYDWRLTAAEPLVVTGFNKRVVALGFDPASGRLYTGDKFGEVFAVEFAADGASAALNPNMVLSHMSMVTRIAIRANHLVTCDRDGAVRVSRLDLPCEIKGFLWLPPSVQKELVGENVTDIVTASTAWLSSSSSSQPQQQQQQLLATGSLEGVVAVWDLSRPDIDQSAALVAPTARCVRAPVAGILTFGDGQFAAAVEGAPTLTGAAFKAPIDLGSPIAVAEGRAALLRNGRLVVFGGQSSPHDAVAVAQMATDVAETSVAALWHTRQRGDDEDGGGKDDGDEADGGAGTKSAKQSRAEAGH